MKRVKVIKLLYLVIMLASCSGMNEKLIISNLIIVNSSRLDITLNTYDYYSEDKNLLEQYLILNQDSIEFELKKNEGDGSASVGELLMADSVTFLFSDGKLLEYRCVLTDFQGCNKARKIFNFHSENVMESKKKRYIFIRYELTEEDYLLSE